MNEGLNSGASRKSKRHVGVIETSLEEANADYIRYNQVTNQDVGLSRRFPLLTMVNRVTPFYVRDIIWTGSIWVAISPTHSSTSTDLINWTVPVSLPANGTVNQWAVLSWNGSMLVAVSEGRYDTMLSSDGWIYTAYSTDSGATWSSGTSFNLSSIPAAFPTTRPVWTGSAWLFMTSFVTGIFRSTDGINWTRNDTSIFDTAGAAYIAPLATNGSGTVIAQSISPILYRSTDHGLTWNRLVIAGGLLSYDSASSKFVLISTDGLGVSTSSDGLTWTEASNNYVIIDTTAQSSRVACSPDYMMVVMGIQLIVISKHPADIALKFPTELFHYTPLSASFQVQYGNSVFVLYPGDQAGFNNLKETYNLTVVEVNSAYHKFVNITGGTLPAIHDSMLKVR